MKRDWDIIREILFKIENLESNAGPLRLNNFPPEKAYDYSLHVEILIEAGLIYGQMSKTIGQHAQNFIAYRLTWQGYEFLDAIRSDNVWHKIKDSFFKGGLSMTYDLVKEAAKIIAIKLLSSKISSDPF